MLKFAHGNARLRYSFPSVEPNRKQRKGFRRDRKISKSYCNLLCT
jgi:hypothetical protein